jgi:hypothetical protein
MRFHRFTAVIVLTGVWAVIVLVMDEDFFGSSTYRSTGFWERYLKVVALGAGGIWALVYFISLAERPPDRTTQKPVALLERRPLIPFDPHSSDRPTHNALVVSEQQPPVRSVAFRSV